LPIYGDGGNVRDWLYVEDHCEAVHLVYGKGEPGSKYNIGGGNEHTNLQIVDALCEALEKTVPAATNASLREKKIKAYKDLKKFVEDRPGHDRRYAIDARKIKKELGWTAKHSFKQALEKTVRWYVDHKDWCESVQSGKYMRERLGLAVNG